MPPAVAHAPIVTSRRDACRTCWIRGRVVGGGHRPLDQREVVGPLDDRAGGLREVGDLDLPGQVEQLVLAVEQR